MMLNKKKNVNSVDTIIGAGTVFEGKLKSSTSLRIEGEVHGEIDCAGDITIGKDGHVDQTVKARNLTLAGTIEGDVEVEEKLILLSTGKLYGKAAMGSLMIEEGAEFDGESKMNKKDAKSKKQDANTDKGKDNDKDKNKGKGKDNSKASA